jgi:3-methyl-2-oxobutanoate hydroxymethyltransferase
MVKGGSMPQITPQALLKLKQNEEKFACVTAYDATFSDLISQSGVEAILVGDSLGMVLQGHKDTLPVTIADMVYHTRAASRGNRESLLISDMPFMSYTNPEQTLQNSAELMRAGAQMVKLEGGRWLCASINLLYERGIPVCAHLGLTPQSVNTLGGFKVQGRTPDTAESIIQDALCVQDAGASLLVLECVPQSLAATITARLTIPVIGIGAGAATDGQVLVLHDLLGLNSNPARFVKDFLAGKGSIQAALEAFHTAVKRGQFPGPEHCFNG